MSETDPERDITDESLPEDLRPTDDNPLARDLTEADEPKSPEELDMDGGKAPEGSEPSGERDEDDSAD